jgi:hypothetical protein
MFLAACAIPANVRPESIKVSSNFLIPKVSIAKNPLEDTAFD